MDQLSERQIVEYLKGLKPGERVIETTPLNMMTGCLGTVYVNDAGCICVMWDAREYAEGTAKMGTSATWGTRRVDETHAVCNKCGNIGNKSTMAAVMQLKTDSMIALCGNCKGAAQCL